MSKARYEVWVGALLAGALVLLAWMAVKVGAVGGMGPQVHVHLRMRDAAGITPGASVQVFGVEVGRVEAMRLETNAAVADVAIGAEFKLKANVTPRIRARSVLGEKYIELVPQEGEAEPMADGFEMEIAVDQIEIDEIVQKSGTLLDQLDVDAIGKAMRFLTDELRRDPQRVQRWFDAVERLTLNTAEASERLTPLMEHADATLSRADAALGEIQSVARDARAPIAKVDGLVAKFEEAADGVPEAVTDARGLIADARLAVEDARKLMRGFEGVDQDLKKVLANFAEIDRWELRRLLREEGILIRLHPDAVIQSPDRTRDVVPAGRLHED